MTAKDSYPRGVPISIKYPEMPVYEFMRNTARKFPDRNAAVYLGAKYTYSQLWSQSQFRRSRLWRRNRKRFMGRRLSQFWRRKRKRKQA